MRLSFVNKLRYHFSLLHSLSLVLFLFNVDDFPVCFFPLYVCVLLASFGLSLIYLCICLFIKLFICLLCSFAFLFACLLACLLVWLFLLQGIYFDIHLVIHLPL